MSSVQAVDYYILVSLAVETREESIEYVVHIKPCRSLEVEDRGPQVRAFIMFAVFVPSFGLFVDIWDSVLP